MRILFFPFTQWISILSFVLCLLRLVISFSFEPWIQVLASVSLMIPEFEIRGTLPLIYILGLMILFSMMDEKKQYIGMSCFVLIFGLCGLNPFARVIFFNVGQGDCTLIHVPLLSRTVLIDTGPPSSYYQLRQSLFAQSIYEIDLLILSHGDLDHSGNLDSILEDFQVKEIWDNTMEKRIDDMFSMQQINDFSMEEEENEKSLVHVFRLNELNFLFLGDAGIEKEKVFSELLSESMDVCKIGHHGSKTSTSWKLLDYAGCKIAVISAKKGNRYGHPHEEVVERLSLNGSVIFNTQIHGDIQILMTRFFNLISTSNHELAIIMNKQKGEE